jgi:hypothetical protein
LLVPLYDDCHAALELLQGAIAGEVLSRVRIASGSLLSLVVSRSLLVGGSLLGPVARGRLLGLAGGWRLGVCLRLGRL